jgi:hypothetical protein
MKKLSALVCLAVLFISGCSLTDSWQAKNAPPDSVPQPVAVIQKTPSLGESLVNPTQATPTQVSGGIALENDECDNPYYPVVNGAWWQYNLSTGAKPLHSMSASADKTFTITVTGGSTTFTFDGSCSDEGIILLEVPGVSASVSGEGSSSTLTTINDDGVTLPNDVQVGDDWSQSISVIGNASEVSLTAHIDTSYKAIGFEIVSTPIGPVNALKVEQTGKLDMGREVTMDIHGYIWYGQGIGVVKTTVDDTFEGTLTTYNIPQK